MATIGNGFFVKVKTFAGSTRFSQHIRRWLYVLVAAQRGVGDEPPPLPGRAAAEMREVQRERRVRRGRRILIG